MHGSMPVYEENAFVKIFRVIDEIHELVGARARQNSETKKLVTASKDLISNDLRRMKVTSADRQAEKLLTEFSMNVGVLRGGTMINAVPEYAEALIAISIPLGGNRKELESKIRKILARPEFRKSVKLELLGESQSSPTYTNPNSNLVQLMYEVVSENLTKPPKLFVTQGTSDGNVYRKHGIETCFYGPGTFENIHGYNESVSVRDTLSVTKAYLIAAVSYKTNCAKQR